MFPMKLCTPSQMQSIDRRAIEGMKIPGLTLMENAGTRVVETILEHFDLSGKRVTVVCGKGNNGGDGFVVARLLHEHGIKIDLFLIGEREAVTGDALTNLERAEKAGLTIQSINNPSAFAIAPDTALIVDAIFGTGFSGPIKTPYDEIVRKINEFYAPVVAVDAPSGLDGASGAVSDPTIKADLTITFGLPKLGQAVYPGKAYCGQLVVADIGFPEKAIHEERINLNILMADEATRMLPFRAPAGNKGDFGKLFVLAGSVGFTGAAALTAEAGLRTGTGLVVLGCAESLNDIFEMKSTEVITHPLPEVRNRRCLALRGLGEVREQVKWADALAVGPGIGTYHETRDLIFRLITKLDKPAVIDADALNNLAKDVSQLKGHPAPLVISPHPGEMARLTGKTIAEIQKDRINIALSFAQEYNLVCILKGAPSVIAAPSGQTWINPTGNEGMATAGSGDVLTGIIGGFLAQGMIDIDAAVLGCYVHGLAGDLARDEFGSRGMIAGDILRMLPEALMEIEGAGY
jgi:ADP-dependent NAD(P)H-hydrate dehydratase / NAD(P)H-hydrate epimerase